MQIYKQCIFFKTILFVLLVFNNNNTIMLLIFNINCNLTENTVIQIFRLLFKGHCPIRLMQIIFELQIYSSNMVALTLEIVYTTTTNNLTLLIFINTFLLANTHKFSIDCGLSGGNCDMSKCLCCVGHAVHVVTASSHFTPSPQPPHSKYKLLSLCGVLCMVVLRHPLPVRLHTFTTALTWLAQRNKRKIDDGVELYIFRTNAAYIYSLYLSTKLLHVASRSRWR